MYNTFIRGFMILKNKSNSLGSLFLFALGILVGIVLFIRQAAIKGRLPELFISTPILFLAYYLITRPVEFINSLDFFQFIAYMICPFLIYLIYWTILLSKEKITSSKANINWADKRWWQTLDGWEFEEEVAKVFELNGFSTHVTKKTGDGGVDIIMYKNNRKFIVQCKHYQSPVEPEPLRALWGVKEDFNADKVILVASSGITLSSKEYIKNKRDFIVYTLEDIIRMGLRPIENEPNPQEDLIKDSSGNKIPIPDFL